MVLSLTKMQSSKFATFQAWQSDLELAPSTCLPPVGFFLFVSVVYMCSSSSSTSAEVMHGLIAWLASTTTECPLLTQSLSLSLPAPPFGIPLCCSPLLPHPTNYASLPITKAHAISSRLTPPLPDGGRNMGLACPHLQLCFFHPTPLM